MDTVRFVVAPHRLGGDDVDAVVPEIDGVALTTIIEAFERRTGFDDPAGGYGGLVPSNYDFGPMDRHFTTTQRPIPLLGCACGEWGCWPLLATVAVDDDRVTWSEFEQPFRPLRDYTSLGTFCFDRRMYDDALRELAERWPSR